MRKTVRGAVFDVGIAKILPGCISIATDRGDAYGDSWSDDNLVTTLLDHTMRALGLHNDLTAMEKRLLLLAALCDVKDARLTGEWKLDSIVDGINYRAVYAAEREAYEADKNRA